MKSLSQEMEHLMIFVKNRQMVSTKRILPSKGFVLTVWEVWDVRLSFFLCFKVCTKYGTHIRS